MKRKHDRPCDKESALMASWLSSSSSSKHPHVSQDSQASNSSVSSCQEINEGNPSYFCYYKDDRF